MSWKQPFPQIANIKGKEYPVKVDPKGGLAIGDTWFYLEDKERIKLMTLKDSEKQKYWFKVMNELFKTSVEKIKKRK